MKILEEKLSCEMARGYDSVNPHKNTFKWLSWKILVEANSDAYLKSNNFILKEVWVSKVPKVICKISNI